MKPFQLNPQQLDALANGATKLFIPIALPDYGFSYDIKQQDSPLQPGESYFVQEKQLNVDVIVGYQNGYPIEQLRDIPADQMTEEQSQYKFTVTGMELKQVQDLLLREMVSLGIKNETAMTERFVPWYDIQYPDKPYSSNPAVFLITIERIENE